LRVNSSESPSVSQGARKLILVILGAMLLLSLYANVQRWRRAKVEKVIFTPPAALPSASPSASLR
jgi:hypothetical protein